MKHPILISILAFALSIASARAQEFDEFLGTSWYGPVTYHFGADAYEQWARELEALDWPADRTKAPKQGDWYDADSMVDQADQVARGRRAAAAFCEQAALTLRNARLHDREVYLRVPLSELERRDTRGLYGRSRRGEEANVVGIDMRFEEPVAPDLVIDNVGIEPAQAAARILSMEGR